MDDFDLVFWPNYPLHKAKKDARKAWAKLAPDAELQAKIVRALVRQVIERAYRLARKEWVPEWPLPASWIRGERWEDEPEPRMTLASDAEVKQFREDMQAKREARAKIAPATSGLDVLP